VAGGRIFHVFDKPVVADCWHFAAADGAPSFVVLQKSQNFTTLEIAMTTTDIWGFTACASLVALTVMWQFYRWRKTVPLLRSWASKNGLDLTSKRLFLPWDLFYSPFSPITMGWVWKYTRFEVRDGEGTRRKGWAYAHGVGLSVLWDSGLRQEVNV
jgi:hypothetical protein